MHEAEKFPQAESLDPTVVEQVMTIARIVGGDYRMKISIGERGQGSFFDMENISITFDPKHLEESPEHAQFVAAHEGAHRAITAGPRKLGLTKQQTRELYEQIGFGFTQNAIEDPAVNDWLSKHFSGLRPLVKQVYDKQFADKGDAKPYFEPIDESETEHQGGPGGIPKFVQFGFEVIRRWHEGWETEDPDLDEEVKRVLDEVAQAAQNSIAMQPKSRRQWSIIRASRKRFTNNTEEIWPSVQKLVEQDIADQTLQQLVKDFVANGKGDHLPEQLQQISDAGDDEAAGSLIMVELDDQTREALEELLANVSADKQQQYEDEALQALKDFEDAINEALKARTDKDHFPSHQELDEAGLATPEAQDNRLDPGTPRRIADLLIEKMYNEQDYYDRVYTEVAPVIADLYHQLQPLLHASRNPGWQSGLLSGQRVNLTTAMQAEAGEAAKLDIWEQKKIPHRTDFRFVVLLDLSLSMRGEKIEESFKGAVTILETLELLGIPSCLIGFDNTPHILKDWSDTLDNEQRKYISENSSADGGHTPTYDATIMGRDKLLANRGKQNFMITITDGDPNDPRMTKELIDEIRSQHICHQVGIGLGPGTDFVDNFYTEALRVDRFSDEATDEDNFAHLLSQLIESLVVRTL